MTATTAQPVAGPASRHVTARLPRLYYAAAVIVPIVLILAWGLLLGARLIPASIARIGQPAPDFALVDLGGSPLRLQDLRGRPVIVNFWASDCGPCVAEFPLLHSAAAVHQRDGLAVVGIVFRDGSEAAREFMTSHGASWPVAMDPGETVATQYGIIGPPDTFFIDRNGIVVGRQIGQLSAADLERGLSQILATE